MELIIDLHSQSNEVLRSPRVGCMPSQQYPNFSIVRAFVGEYDIELLRHYERC